MQGSKLSKHINPHRGSFDPALNTLLQWSIYLPTLVRESLLPRKYRHSVAAWVITKLRALADQLLLPI